MPPEKVQRKALSEGLARLNETMGTMAQLSELAIRKAVESMESAEAFGAEEVFALDREIYALKHVAEETCANLIALHAPVARDLRTITASLEVTTDLDRIGRYARDIAEATEFLRREQRETSAPTDRLRQMLELTVRMVDTAIYAFVGRDAEPVRDIDSADDAVDRLHDEVFEEVTARMTNRTLPPRVGAQYILINRYLERIADHAVNIGEHLTYMLTGSRRYPLRPEKMETAHSRTDSNAPPASGASTRIASREVANVDRRII
jgi:phosphate transport system protein